MLLMNQPGKSVVDSGVLTFGSTAWVMNTTSSDHGSLHHDWNNVLFIDGSIAIANRIDNGPHH